MKIGIGITTTTKRTVTTHYGLLAPKGAEVLTYVDQAMLGPARARNVVLKSLYDSGCEHIFTFDDDCYPVLEGWADYIIAQAQLHNIDFVGLPSPFESVPLGSRDELVFWNSVLGCFTYQTRKAMDTVGYYNTAYERYGHEDNARSYRAVKAGLTGRLDAFASFMRVPFYVHSEDAYSECPAANMSQADKDHYIELNRAEYTRETLSDQLYYPFS